MTQIEMQRWATARAMKKDFQKVIKMIRDENNAHNDSKSSFPKPMMTDAQIDKSTATVNCGGEWGSFESTKKKADIVMSDKRFTDFLTKWNATATVEHVSRFNVLQIRISY